MRHSLVTPEYASDGIVFRKLGRRELTDVYADMRRFTDDRGQTTPDEVWFVEHPPVFTLGLSGNTEHLLDPREIPVVNTDRGGQVTYHGPGQLVGYLLIDLKRRKLGVRDLVTAIEQALVKVLAELDIEASPRADAPGVYVKGEPFAGAKIAQLGLRVRRGCTFHGLSLNIDMDMEPFLRINPCGHVGMVVTSVALQTGGTPSFDRIADRVGQQLVSDLGYTAASYIRDAQLP